MNKENEMETETNESLASTGATIQHVEKEMF